MKGLNSDSKYLVNRMQEQAEPVLQSFDLNEDESRRFVYNDKQMIVESSDPLLLFLDASRQKSDVQVENQEQPQSLVKEVLVKQEEHYQSQPIYFNSQTVEQDTNTLKPELQKIKILQNQARVIQQIIFATSNDPIYRYPIGFESKYESQQKQRTSDKKLRKSKSSSWNYYNKVIDKNIKLESKQQQQLNENLSKESKIIISTAGDPSLDLLEYPWVIDVIIGAKQRGITSGEKRMFLDLLQKIECMKRGIVKIMYQQNKGSHTCGVCGQLFTSGRKLGGHMSRKHPGFSYDYFVKKQVHKTKEFERSRRRYFQNQKLTKKTKKQADES